MKTLRTCLIIVLTSVILPSLQAKTASKQQQDSTFIKYLTAQPYAELDRLFKQTSLGPQPQGLYKGIPLLVGQYHANQSLNWVIDRLLWKGKLIEPQKELVTNMFTPYLLQGIRAKFYLGLSEADQKPAYIVDYSSKRAYLPFDFWRDELREIKPGFYLGRGYTSRSLYIYFAIQKVEKL